MEETKRRICMNCHHLQENNVCSEIFPEGQVVIGNPAEFSCVKFQAMVTCRCRICRLKMESDQQNA